MSQPSRHTGKGRGACDRRVPPTIGIVNDPQTDFWTPGRSWYTQRFVKTTLTALGLLFVTVAGCKGNDEAAKKAAAEKTALETAVAGIGSSIATISVYAPHLQDPGAAEKFASKQRGDIQHATEHAATEIRHAANSARQRVEQGDSPNAKALADALGAISTACTDAKEQPQLDACAAKVNALNDAISKFEAACTAAGITAKVPHVGPESVTDEAKKAIASYLKARGPAKAEVDFGVKRADPKATVAAVLEACRAAATETEQVADLYERSEGAIRLVASTHKMAIASQCKGLEATEIVQKEINDCRKKPKTATECRTACGKAQTIIEEGIPAAVFANLQKDHDEVCEK